MSKFRILAVSCVLIMMSGCFAGGVTQGKNTFSADGTTLNLFGMKMNLTEEGFQTKANSHDIAAKHIPEGGKITSVSTTPHWKSQGFPMVIIGLWNEYILGYTSTQISGTK